MRVLVNGVGRDSYPTGICRVAASHAKALVASGVASRVFLAIGVWQYDLYCNLLGNESTGVDFVVADLQNNSIARNFWHATKLPQLAAACRADFVHLTYPVPTVRKAFHCPVVVTLHDLYPYDIPENFGFPQYYANRAILRQCLSSVDGIACVSNTTKIRMEQIFPRLTRRVPVAVTRNYIEIPSDTPTPPSSPDTLELQSFVLAVAQHRKNKNLDLLLSSFANLENRAGFKGILVIVGSEGPETAMLAKLCQSLGIVTRVKFIHSIVDSELHWLYANCSVFVACSSIEGYCLPLVEAQANRARVVCSDIAILREIGGTQCTYFPLGTNAVENLARAMTISLKRNPSECVNSYQTNMPSVINEYLKLYMRVASSASPQVCAHIELKTAAS